MCVSKLKCSAFGSSCVRTKYMISEGTKPWLLPDLMFQLPCFLYLPSPPSTQLLLVHKISPVYLIIRFFNTWEVPHSLLWVHKKSIQVLYSALNFIDYLKNTGWSYNFGQILKKNYIHRLNKWGLNLNYWNKLYMNLIKISK